MSHILTVDDSKWVGQMLGHILKTCGHSVSHALDGHLGVAAAKMQSFDMVITDIHMPTMNGLELIESLRAMDDYHITPILCVTMESSETMRERAKKLGADAWLMKPIVAEHFIQVVGECFLKAS